MIKLSQEKMPDGRLIVRGADGDRKFAASIRPIAGPTRRWLITHATSVGGKPVGKVKAWCDSPGKVADHLAGLVAWALTSAVMDAVTAVSRGEVARLGLKL